MREDETLPAGWETTTIGAVADVLRGVTYRKEDARSEPADGLCGLLRATNIGPELDFDELVYVPNGYVSSDQWMRSGDIVVASSSGSLSVVGKGAQLRCDWQGSFGAFCAVVRPSPQLDARFLAVFMQTEGYRRRVSALAAGSNINNLRRDHILEIPLPVPPREQQRRIVAALEQQLSRIEAGVAALERAKANLERYRASVLKAACEGRLVPTEAELARAEGRTYEPASELLARILKERRERWEADQLARMKARGKPPKDDAWKKKYPEPAAPDTSALPDLPEGWCWATTDQLFSFVTSGSRGWAKHYSEAGAAFIRIGNLDHDSISLDLSEIQHVSPPSDAEGIRTRVASGDVLISITADVGMIALVPDQIGEAYINQHVSLARPVAERYAPYLAWFLAARDGGQRQFLALQRGATKVGLGLDDIRSINVPLPPLHEEHRIIDEVERRISLDRRTAASLSATERRTQNLRQSLLAHAFSGKLVPQDPTDEPASVLLERIRKEREAAAAEKPKQPARRASPRGRPRKTAPKGTR